MVNTAKKNGIEWRELDLDDPNYSDVTGTKHTILGETNIWIKLNNIKEAQEIIALVCKEESNESLVDLDSLEEMGIIHKDFPPSIDRNMRENTG